MDIKDYHDSPAPRCSGKDTTGQRGAVIATNIKDAHPLSPNNCIDTVILEHYNKMVQRNTRPAIDIRLAYRGKQVEQAKLNARGLPTVDELNKVCTITPPQTSAFTAKDIEYAGGLVDSYGIAHFGTCKPQQASQGTITHEEQ